MSGHKNADADFGFDNPAFTLAVTAGAGAYTFTPNDTAINALTAADSLLVPVQCEFYALDALGRLQDTIQLVRDHLNPRLAVKGVLLTMFDARTSLSAGVAADVRTYFGDKVFRTAIPRSVRLAEAPSHEQPIALYSPTSSGARAYEDLAHEILRRDGRSTTPVAA